MFNKKGVSDIVTTVLIILLVLAAVSIVGNIIMKNLQKGGEQIEKSTDCLNVEVTPLLCKMTGNNTYTVQYKWTKGGDMALSSVKLFVYDDKGLNAVADGDRPDFLGVVEGTVKTDKLKGMIDYARVAPVIKSSTGEDNICSESDVKVSCK
ncbi:TPA: hypothetical protein HA371_07025 [Candidatus Woesearchaeota archaeon]|nr:hypothetical protein [Candidatus Woesearchaeota archaeon]